MGEIKTDLLPGRLYEAKRRAEQKKREEEETRHQEEQAQANRAETMQEGTWKTEDNKAPSAAE